MGMRMFALNYFDVRGGNTNGNSLVQYVRFESKETKTLSQIRHGQRHDAVPSPLHLVVSFCGTRVGIYFAP